MLNKKRKGNDYTHASKIAALKSKLDKKYNSPQSWTPYSHRRSLDHQQCNTLHKNCLLLRLSCLCSTDGWKERNKYFEGNQEVLQGSTRYPTPHMRPGTRTVKRR